MRHLQKLGLHKNMNHKYVKYKWLFHQSSKEEENLPSSFLIAESTQETHSWPLVYLRKLSSNLMLLRLALPHELHSLEPTRHSKFSVTCLLLIIASCWFVLQAQNSDGSR